MFLLVSVRHVGAHPDELQHGVSIQSSINLGKTFQQIIQSSINLGKTFQQIIQSSINLDNTFPQILARVFVYLAPFISQILDLICRMVLIFILIYFEWRDTENQQYVHRQERRSYHDFCYGAKLRRADHESGSSHVG